MSSRLPELLAPAGNLHCALAAFDNGADAVYAGLSRFNAREMGDNFSWTDLAKLTTRAKQTGKKIYMTLNTLVKESEFDDFAATVERLAGYEPDGIIVQDLGVAAFIRDNFPGIELHASTQMGFHNSAGLETAGRLGIRRVIMERQITLDELRTMADWKPPVDLEVFIHGALCCSLSGQCLFSSWMGGWSGNRGKCKQPCRRRYYSGGADRRSAGFYFSTQDLYSLDLVSEYIRLGIRALKIEGRLKKPDYVAAVVKAYRRVLDSGGEDSGVIRESRGILSRSYGRRWSHGFASEEDMKQVVQYDSIGVSGQLIGRVEGVREGSFDVRLGRTLHVGDRVRVQPDSGDEGPAFTVDSIILAGRSARQASKGNTVTLRYDGELHGRGNLYIIGVHTPLPEAAIGALEPFMPRRPVTLVVSVSRRDISIRVEGLPGSPVFSKELNLDEAQRHPLDETDLLEAFRHTKNDPYRVALLRAEILENPFFPASHLKNLRREFRSWLHPLAESAGDYVFTPRQKAPVPQGRAGTPRDLRGACRTSGGSGTGCPKGAYRVGSVYGFGPGTEEVVLPAFCPEGALGHLEQQVERAYKSGIRRFRLTSLYQFRLIASYDDLIICTSYPLPAVNGSAMDELARHGVSRIQGWLELGKDALEELKKRCPVNFEIYRRGKPPILVTRASVAVTGPIQDGRGKMFTVEHDENAKLTFLYPAEPMEMPRMKGTAEYIDMSHLNKNDPPPSDFNYTRGLR